jgi:hypothetical protein
MNKMTYEKIKSDFESLKKKIGNKILSEAEIGSIEENNKWFFTDYAKGDIPRYLVFLPTRKLINQNSHSTIVEAIAYDGIFPCSCVEDCFLVRVKKDPELDLEKCPQELKNLLSFIYG